MSLLPYSHQKSELSGGYGATNQLDFSVLYDRYASALLGIITKSILNEAEALVVLEVTFKRVRSEINQFRPEQQPIFIWLLAIARSAISEALTTRRSLLKPTFQLDTMGKIVALPTRVAVTPVNFVAESDTLQLKTLLDAVLFENCTPEEAAISIGIPVETARAQLRLAMQQLRTLPNA